MRRSSLIACLVAAGLVGCGETDTPAETTVPGPVRPADVAPSAPITSATAALKTADGTPAGTATATAAADGILVALSVEGLPPGTRGTHVHMVGNCEPPTFDSAGDHWNPSNAQHGLENPRGPHAGDMPNLTIGPDGRAALSFTLPGRFESFLDGDGAAMVVHAKGDDQRTDPSGDSGDRIACGVFARQ